MRVVVAAYKGGTGKTTAAVALAEAGAHWRGSALLVDADPQASAMRWAEMAADDGGSGLRSVVVSLPTRDLARRLAGLRADDYPLTVVDCPPGSEPITAAALDGADVAVVTCRPAVGDLDRAWPTLEAAESAGVPSLVLLTMTRTRTRSLEATRSVLADAGVNVADVTVPQREAIAAAWGTRPGRELLDIGEQLIRATTSTLKRHKRSTRRAQF